MATTGVHNGHVFRFYRDSVAVAKATSGTMSITVDEREIAHKDVGGPTGWGDAEAGIINLTFSIDALYAETDGESFADFYADMVAGASVDMQYGNTETGDIRYDFAALITGMDLTADNNENVIYSVTGRNKGVVTLTTIV